MIRITGIDLGQSQDPAAAAVVDRIDREGPQFIGPPNPLFRPKLVCRQLRTWRLDTDYTEIVEDILQLPTDVLLIDFGGVGRPVVDLLRKRAAQTKYTGKIRPIQLIGSNARAKVKNETRGSHFNVPKVDIVNSITIAQERKMLVLPAVKESKTLLQQLRDFRMRVTKAANLQFGNKPGSHDDLVIALGLCCWWGLKFGNMQPRIWCG